MTIVGELTIRGLDPATREDLEEVRAVLGRANEQFAGLVPGPLFAAYLEDVLDIERRLPRSRTLVAVSDGHIVGTVGYFRDANDEGIGPSVPRGTAGIRAVAVDPVARGRGIGRRLAAAAVAMAREDGAPAVILHTWSVMRGAIRVYEDVGFRRAPAFDAASSTFFASESAEDVPALAFWLTL